MRIIKSTLISAGFLALMSGAAIGNSGVFGGWAADKADCRYVNTTVGVSRNVTAGVITPKNVFFYGGECDVTAYPRPGGYTFKGVCDEGDGPYNESLEVILKEPNKIRAKWPDIGWTSFYRCWDLPKNWKELSK